MNISSGYHGNPTINEWKCSNNAVNAHFFLLLHLWLAYKQSMEYIVPCCAKSD